MTVKAKRRVPSYRHHKGSGQAFIELSGRRHYLGAYGTAASREAYARKLAEWEAGNRGELTKPTDLTVVELIARFMDHAEARYRKPDGTPTTTLGVFKIILRPLKELYGRTQAAQFGSKAMAAVRQRMIEHGWKRESINSHLSRIRQVFRWGVAQELIPVSTWDALKAVEGLRAGAAGVEDSEPVRPVPQPHIDAIRPYLSRQVWAIVQLQLLTGARAGELVLMRAVDIDTTGRIWLYQPDQHKTAHHGHKRTVYLGPKAQAVVQPFLSGRAVDEFLFSPADAAAEQRERRARLRKTPMNQGNRPGTNRTRRPRRTPGERYDVPAYRRAIQRACAKAGVPRWHPHQLRHNAATMLRKEFGIEAARIILGHKSATMTDIYAELDTAKAIDVIGKVG